MQKWIGNGKMDIKRGDILFVNFEPVRGREQGRMRPALVVQNDILNKFSPLTIVAPITSKIYKKEYPHNIFIKKYDSGLDKDSTILLNQIRTIDKLIIIKRLSYLNFELMKKVDNALKVSLGLD